jgi:hypothetical protein
MSNPIDTTRLCAAAAEASMLVEDVDGEWAEHVGDLRIEGERLPSELAVHIELASPSTMLALLDELERTRKELDEAHAACDRVDSLNAQLGDECHELRSKLGHAVQLGVEGTHAHERDIAERGAMVTSARAERNAAQDRALKLEAKLERVRSEERTLTALNAQLNDKYLTLAMKLHSLADEYAGPRPIDATPESDLAALEDRIAGAESERDEYRRERDELRAQLEQAERERDELHATLKAVADLCIDKAGLRVCECVAVDAPPRAVAKIIEQRDEARRERDAAGRASIDKGVALFHAENERDAAIARAEAADLARDHLEARIVALIDAAHAGPVEVPSDVSREVARVVNAVRINVRMRERAEESLALYRSGQVGAESFAQAAREAEAQAIALALIQAGHVDAARFVNARAYRKENGRE